MDTVTVIPTRRNGLYSTLNGGKGRLSGMVESLLTAAPATQLSLLEELALARAQVADLIAVYEALVANVDGSLKMQETLILGERLRGALKDVAKIAKTAASVELAKSISPTLVTALAVSIESAITELAPGDLREALLDRLQQSFHTLTTNATAKDVQVLSPSDLCAAMDSTIPIPDVLQHKLSEEGSLATESAVAEYTKALDQALAGNAAPVQQPAPIQQPAPVQQAEEVVQARALANAMQAAQQATTPQPVQLEEGPSYD